jgi:Na+-exporting ATPase
VLLFCVAVVCAIIVLAANGFSNEQEVIIYAVATGLSMIVRNLKSLEALGAVTDICSDKTGMSTPARSSTAANFETGTLTQGKMITKKAYVPACGALSVEDANEPFNPTDGSIRLSKDYSNSNDSEKSGVPMDTTSAKSDSNLSSFLDVAALANISTVWQGAEDGAWHARGDPTEIAINVFAARFGWSRTQLIGNENPAWKTLVKFPFDSDVKKMSVILENTGTGKLQVFTKGAVERVLQSCSNFYATNDTNDSTEMTDDHRDRILEIMEDFASYGLRVLALASRVAPSHLNYEKELDRNQVECDLTFRGLVGLYDPPRTESAASVKECRLAGIEVHMLTGDHPGTARAIAIDVGILPSLEKLKTLPKDVADALVMTAGEFDKLNDDQIDQLPQLPLVVARCAPNTKVRMIEALHRRKRFAAMVRPMEPQPSHLHDSNNFSDW